MSTPTTLQAKLTGDVGDAQAAIARLIKTVEDLGSTVNASSQVGQRAFKAEASEVRRLALEMGASEKQLGRLESAVKGFDQRVAQEQRAAAQAAQALRQNYAMASKDVVSGLGEIATAGRVTSGALRDLVQGAGEIALSFGPQSVFMGAIAVATASIITMFTDARAQLEETQREFKKRLDTMKRDANVGGLREEAIRADEAARAAAAALERARAQGVGEGSPVARISRFLSVWGAERDSTTAARNRDAAFDALRNPGGGVRTGFMMPTRTITEDSPEAAQRKAAERARAASDRARRTLADAQTADMNAFGLEGGTGRINTAPRMASRNVEETSARMLREAMESTRMIRVQSPETGVFDGIAASASKAVTPMRALRLELGETGKQLKDVGKVAKASIPGAVAAGVDAIVYGQGNAIKAMKRALAEPIVMHLKAEAVKSFALAAVHAGSPATWSLIPANLAGGAKALAGAAIVARLGGLAGGGGDAGGGGGVNGAALGRTGASASDAMMRAGDASTRPLRVELVIVQKAPDGRELARQRQMVQRLDDRNQPLRVTL